MLCNLILVDVFQVCGEKNRFEKLMEFFCKEDKNIDFMVYLFKTLKVKKHLLPVYVINVIRFGTGMINF